MNIAEQLGTDGCARLLASSLRRGDVLFLRLDKNDGITPKCGDTYRDKFLIVLGVNNGYALLGGVVVNSQINQRLAPEIRDYHYKISKGDHPFLQYDSFVDCSRLIKAPFAKLAEAKIAGRIIDEELELIVGAVKNGPRVRKTELRMFNLE